MGVSYDKEQRQIAKDDGLHLVTIAWEQNGRGRVWTQTPCSDRVLKYVQRAHEHLLKLLAEGR